MMRALQYCLKIQAVSCGSESAVQFRVREPNSRWTTANRAHYFLS